MKVVDVQFNIQGNNLPADHGYHLFSSIAKLIPEVHDNEEIGVFSIPGQLNGNRIINLNEKSCLTLRIPAEMIKLFLSLSGKTLNVDGYNIIVGVPHTKALIPAARLYSRIVIIKGFMDPEGFIGAVKRQLEEMEIKGLPFLVEQNQVAERNKDKTVGTKSPYLRRTIKVRDKNIVGFALRVVDLTAEESIKLQECGIGGRRRFGCGIFIPDRR